MYIGIDLGTSGVKTILIDHAQNIISVAHANLTVQSPKDGFKEQNPKNWVKATEKCLVEMAGIEPASENLQSRSLHA